MRLLFLGDIMGRPGRDAITAQLPRLRQDLNADFVVANGENATSGMGLSPEHANDILNAGVDCITLGDHAFDQREMQAFIERETRILRPVNFAKTAPGKGANLYTTGKGKRVFVAQILGQVFMKRPYNDPFGVLEGTISAMPLGVAADAIIVDVHAEATSEKMAMGHYLDGRASLVVGTHTHVPTADAQILPGGTAYQSDSGMCGVYNSVIGMDKDEPINRFVTGMRKARFTPATGEATLAGVFIETDDATGKALRVEPVRLGGSLSRALPD